MSSQGDNRDIRTPQAGRSSSEVGEGRTSPTPPTPLRPSESQVLTGSGSDIANGSQGNRSGIVPRGDIRLPNLDVLSSPSNRSGVPRTPSIRGSGSQTDSMGRTPLSPGSTPVDSDLLGATGTEHEVSQDNVIWGTTVNIQTSMATFRDFIHHYKPEADESSEPFYRRSLAELRELQGTSLNVDCRALAAFSPAGRRLYEQLLMYPQEIIGVMDAVVNAEFRTFFPDDEDDVRIQVRVYNLNTVRRMRDLNPSDVDTLVCVRGMVTRCSSLIPDLRVAFFRCTRCGTATEVLINRGRIEEPAQCPACSARRSLEMVHNRSVFKDKQLVKIQEAPENVPEGQTPHSVTVYSFEDLCDTVVPGDRVLITGIYRALPFRPNPRTRNLTATFKTYVDALHFQKSERGREAEREQQGEDEAMDGTDAVHHLALGDGTGDEVDPAVLAKCREMAEDPQLYENLVKSLAPSIWEMEDVKKGILLQLFGGTRKEMGDNGKARGEINVLLCGDPGTSKSQLLGYVNKVAPRGIYTSGKGSSAVGLTAYIGKDPETRQPILESGALVLSDRGVCCIDEFDKMDDSTRSILHEVMEQQTISIAKAGIIATLNARTAILASANPVDSRYNPHKSVVENIQLPPTLLSRFDLIYLVLDKPNAASDRQLARHLVSLYYDPEDSEIASPPYSLRTVTDYVAYTKQHVHPEISDGAVNGLVRGYVSMRQQGQQGGKKTISATPRQLESSIRLAEAHARMRMSALVEEEDVTEALRLMTNATQRAATDPRTGLINMEMITTGRSALDPEKLASLVEAIVDIIGGVRSGGTIGFGALVKRLQNTSSIPVSDTEVEEALQNMQQDGTIDIRAGDRRLIVVK